MDNFLTVNEYATANGLHPNTVQLMVREGRLAAHKVGRAWRIATDAVPAPLGKATEVAKSESSKTEELDRLTRKRDELKMAKEVKTLEAEISGIFTGADQERIAKAQKELDVGYRELAEREEILLDSKAELGERRDALLKLEEEWKEHFRAGLHDLEAIRGYYREVVRLDKKAVQVLDPKLQLNPEWLNEDANEIESNAESEDDIIE